MEALTVQSEEGKYLDWSGKFRGQGKFNYSRIFFLIVKSQL